MSKQQVEWLNTLQREANIRSGLVLYGNTRDLFWSGKGSNYLTLPALLTQELDQFSIRATWDRVEGLRFGDEHEARQWEQALERGLAGDSRPIQSQAYDLGDDEPPTPTSAAGIRVELDELLARYRLVSNQERHRALLIIDWSHLLITQPAHPDPEERLWLLRLAKVLQGKPTQRIDSDTLKRGQGLVIVVSANLGAVPPVLYQGDPRIRLLSLPMPGREERGRFFERHADDLVVDAPRAAPGAAPAPPRRAKVDALADLTDQLSTVDLQQLVTLSRTLDTPLPPDRLLNLYRFGEQKSPWEELSEERLTNVDEVLKQRVIGQDGAVEHVSTMIIRAWLGLAGLQHSARRITPKGTLFFVGPTGVGKTELAKACAEFLFGDETACIRFDMSEYNHEHSDQRLVGAPPGYVGFEEGGQLTNAVRARPFSVLLFDEIEKAHGRVLDKFLQILEDGRLTDGRGETAWFSESVLIFTSNIGAAEVPANGDSGSYHRHFRDAVEAHFVQGLRRPELLNRLGDNIVVFEPIADQQLRQNILLRKLEPLREHLQERWGVKLDLDEQVLSRLIESARMDHGGRGLLNAVERELLNPLARFLFERHGKLRSGRCVQVCMEGKLIDFELRDGR